MSLGSPCGGYREVNSGGQSLGGRERGAGRNACCAEPQNTPGPAPRTEPRETSEQDVRDVRCLYPLKTSAQAS